MDYPFARMRRTARARLPRMQRPGGRRSQNARPPDARSKTPSRSRSTTARSRALIPYARNARTHSEAQVALIAGSIREYGFTNPVLVDGENGIIAGHGRVLAARKLGLAAVPVIELAPPQREPEARLRPRRQPPRRAGRLGPRDAGAGGGRPQRARRRPRHPRLRGGRARRAADATAPPTRARRRRPSRPRSLFLSKATSGFSGGIGCSAAAPPILPPWRGSWAAYGRISWRPTLPTA